MADRIDDWKATRLSEMIDKLGGGQKSFTDALILSRVIILERSDFENDNKRRTGCSIASVLVGSSVGFCFKLVKASVTVANVDTQRQTKKRVKPLGE